MDHQFRKLRHQPRAKEIALDSIRRTLPQRNPTNATIEAPLTIQFTDEVTEYTSAEVGAAAKLDISGASAFQAYCSAASI